MTVKISSSRLLTLMILLGLSGFLGSSGCAAIAGISKDLAKEGTAGANPTGDGDGDGNGTGGGENGDLEVDETGEDPETEITTTGLCIRYCDSVMKNCEGEHGQYLSRAACLNTCNALDAGEEAEPVGNNVRCRLTHAQAAGSTPDEECTSAGPGGFPSCGSACESWCGLLESECPDDYSPLSSCSSACRSLADTGGFSLEDDYTADNIQCRLIHLGAVGGDPESPHCGHGRYVNAEKCVPNPDPTKPPAPPTCEEYCRVAQNNCTGSNAIYEDEDQCMAACEALELGTFEDTVTNTVGCRIYHGKSSATSPSTHCDHASPTGDGHCGNASEETGNCLSYCQLLAEGCETDFDELFSSEGDCVEKCREDFEDRGAANDTFYQVSSAPDEDTLQCRVYHSVLALAAIFDDAEDSEVAEECQLARADGTCGH